MDCSFRKRSRQRGLRIAALVCCGHQKPRSNACRDWSLPSCRERYTGAADSRNRPAPSTENPRMRPAIAAIFVVVRHRAPRHSFPLPIPAWARAQQPMISKRSYEKSSIGIIISSSKIMCRERKRILARSSVGRQNGIRFRSRRD